MNQDAHPAEARWKMSDADAERLAARIAMKHGINFPPDHSVPVEEAVALGIVPAPRSQAVPVDTSRIAVRFTGGERAFIERAAAIAGESIEDFVLNAALAKARSVIDEVASAPVGARATEGACANCPHPRAEHNGEMSCQNCDCPGFTSALRSRSVSPSEGEREALARATDDEIEMWAQRDLQGDPAGGFRAQALLYSGRVEGAKWMRDLLRSRAAGSASISDESVSAAQRVLAERYGYPLSAAAVMDALLAAQGAGSASSALPEGVTLEVVAEAIKACAVAAHRLGAIGDALDRAFEAAATEEAPRAD